MATETDRIVGGLRVVVWVGVAAVALAAAAAWWNAVSAEGFLRGLAFFLR